MPGESQEEWEAFRDDIVKRYHPADSFETELAERIALQMWRFRRVTRFETQTITDGLGRMNRNTAFTLTGIYADTQTVKQAWKRVQDERADLAVVPVAQEVLGQLHNLPADSPVAAEPAWLLQNVFREDAGPEPRATTAGALRCNLAALAKRPLAQALHVAEEKLETRRKELEAAVTTAQHQFEFYANETAQQGDEARNQYALPQEDPLKRVLRYESQVSRQLEQAIRLLEKAQAARKAQEDAEAVPEDEAGRRDLLRELVFEEIARRLEQGEDSSFGNDDDPSRKRERRPGTGADGEGTVADASGSEGGSESGAGEFVPRYASAGPNGRHAPATPARVPELHKTALTQHRPDILRPGCAPLSTTHCNNANLDLLQ